MRPQKRTQDDFGHKHLWFIISGGFWVAESIFAIFKWFGVMVTAQSCVKAVRGRQNCLKVLVSKYSHVICLLIGFWGRWTHFRHLFGYLTAVGHHRTIEGRLGRENICGGVAMDDVLDKNTCQIIYRRRAMGFPTLIFYVISGGFGVQLWLLNMKWPLSHIWFGGLR